MKLCPCCKSDRTEFIGEISQVSIKNGKSHRVILQKIRRCLICGELFDVLTMEVDKRKQKKEEDNA